MTRSFRSAGVNVAVDCVPNRLRSVVDEALVGAPALSATSVVEVSVRVEAAKAAFPTKGWTPLTRGAWTSHGRVIVEDACSSGLDLLVEPSSRGAYVVARSRPDFRNRGLNVASPSRHHLLARAVLLQYPAMWWASVTGRVPLHASALFVGGSGVVLAGPGGTGKSTLLAAELALGGMAVSDNLCVSDGATLEGVVEPLRIAGGTGRRMSHGRREVPWGERADALAADLVVVLTRGDQAEAVVRSVPALQAARVLTAGTYAAGELRRYWAFAATLALGTGLGPPHPPVGEVAARLTASVPCAEVVLPACVGTRLRDLRLDGVVAC